MIPAAAAGVRDGKEFVVLAWDAPWIASADQRVAALATLLTHAGHAAAGIVIPLGHDAAELAPRIAELLASRRTRALPLIHLSHPRVTEAWTRSVLPAALDTLAEAGVLCEFDGIRYAVAATNGTAREFDAVAAVRQTLSTPGRSARIGWLRRASSHIATPPALDFALDWPPYGDVVDGGRDRTRQHTYTTLALDLAKRQGGDAVVVPSVLWSPLDNAEIFEGTVGVTDISPLKISFAIDLARRFVRNRMAHGAPFWVLRAGFSPDDRRHAQGLESLGQALAQTHRPSAAIGQVAALARRAPPCPRIAVVVHLYYPDLWPELARAIEALPEPFDLFVSCPYRVLSATRRMIGRTFPQAAVFGVQNLGRDVLPFLLWLRESTPLGYQYILKVHGKRSVHIVDPEQAPFGGGDAWRRTALAGLIGDDGHAGAVLRALDAMPDVGLVAAAGHLYDQVKWKCATTDLVATALQRLGMDRTVQGKFPAGTMFWARADALAPLASVTDDMLDFEREAGQVDGTLHHAYERLFALVARDRGYRVIDSAELLH